MYPEESGIKEIIVRSSPTCYCYFKLFQKAKVTVINGANKLKSYIYFLAPLKSYLELQQWSYNLKFWLFSYSA